MQTAWTYYSRSLNGYGTSAALKWLFTSNASVQAEGWYVDSLMVAGTQTGDYRVCVQNNDNDTQTVGFKTDLDGDFYRSIVVGPGATVCSAYATTDAGAHTITIGWIDPETSQPQSLSQSLSVAWKGAATADFFLPRNARWDVRVQKDADDCLTVHYLLHPEMTLGEITVPAGEVLTSPSWPDTDGDHQAGIQWTDPDMAVLVALDPYPAQG